MIFVKKSLIFVYMKRNILLLFTVLLAMSVNAQSIKWYTFEEAVKLINKQGFNPVSPAGNPLISAPPQDKYTL